VSPLVVVIPAGAGGELGAALTARAVAWGEAVGEVRVLEGAPSHAAIARAVGDHAGPVLVVAGDQPRLSAFHADAALHDLSDGADLAVGPALDGGRYLLALTALRPGGRELPAELWDADAGMETTLRLAGEAGLEVGLLRPERGLRTPDDVRAARADPLFPPEIAALL
jgi:glycosyltransferase A (GT-A) superfamily protein (DUF2064 family)